MYMADSRETACGDASSRLLLKTLQSCPNYMTEKSKAKKYLTRSGLNPKPRISLTLFCVGFVFCSPVESG